MPEIPGKNPKQDLLDSKDQDPQDEAPQGLVPTRDPIDDQRPSFLRDEPDVFERVSSETIAARAAILARLRKQRQERHPGPPISEKVHATRIGHILERSRNDLSRPNPWAVLRQRLYPGQNAPSPTFFDPHASLPVTLVSPLPHVPLEVGDLYEERPQPPAIVDAAELAQDPLPYPKDSLARDLIGTYEIKYKQLQRAIDGDEETLKATSVPYLIAEIADVEKVLDDTAAGYMEEYASAAEAAIGRYRQHKNTLESLVAVGTREVEELKPEATEIRAAYNIRITQMRKELSAIKKALVNLAFKILATVSVYKVLQQMLATRGRTIEELRTVFAAEASANEKFAAFAKRCAAATETTAALTMEPVDSAEYATDPIAKNMLELRNLLDTAYVPIFLADTITDNGLTFSPNAIDPAKVMEIRGVHLQAMRHEGYDLQEWSEILSKAGTLEHELGLIIRLVKEALAPHIKSNAR